MYEKNGAANQLILLTNWLKKTKILLLALIILLGGTFLLTGCEFLPFIEGEPEGLPKHEVPKVVNRYYNAIENRNIAEMRDVLHPDGELEIVYAVEFLGTEINIDEEIMSIDRYESDYSDNFFVNYEIDTSEDGITLENRTLNSSDEGEHIYEYEADVSKNLIDEQTGDEEEYSYSLYMEVEGMAAGWFIYRIEKDN